MNKFIVGSLVTTTSDPNTLYIIIEIITMITNKKQLYKVYDINRKLVLSWYLREENMIPTSKLANILYQREISNKRNFS